MLNIIEKHLEKHKMFRFKLQRHRLSMEKNKDCYILIWFEQSLVVICIYCIVHTMQAISFYVRWRNEWGANHENPQFESLMWIKKTFFVCIMSTCKIQFKFVLDKLKWLREYLIFDYSKYGYNLDSSLKHYRYFCIGRSLNVITLNAHLNSHNN